MVERGDGVLRLPPQSIDLGGVLVDRANAFLSSHPNSEDKLRRILTLKLATVRENGEPTRRRAWRSEFSEEEWRLINELADHPNRLITTVTPEIVSADAGSAVETRSEAEHLCRSRARSHIPALGQTAWDGLQPSANFWRGEVCSRSTGTDGKLRPRFQERRVADGIAAKAGDRLARQAPRRHSACRP